MTAKGLSIIVMLITLLRLILGGLIIKEGVNNKDKREKVMRYLIGVKKLSDTPLNKVGLFHSSKSQSLNHLWLSHLCPSVMDKKPKLLKRFRAIV